jgi:hypothetical protein
MRPTMRSALPLVLCLAACTPDETDAVQKEVAGLRADLQKAQKENEKLRSQVATAEGRLNGLAEDLARVRQFAVDVKAAPAPEAPADGAAAAAPEPSPAPPSVVAIKTYLASEDGRKVLAEAIEADRTARAREQSKRRIDAQVDRFAKSAGLTEDQVKRVKEVLERQAEASRVARAALNDLDPDATQDQRDELRRQTTAKTEEIRKASEDQLRAVLTPTQFDAYQQEQTRLRRSPRADGGGRRNNGGAGNGNDLDRGN